MGPGVKCGYMPQIVAFENPAATVLQTFCAETGDAEAQARNTLAVFHFSAEEVFKKVESLSGGEKSRLRLCLLMQKDIDFLLLDEPTNHLDIMSREWIENALSGFQGTMLFVSHDRYFLNKFARKVWSMENGAVSEYDCGFDEYAERRQNASVPKEAAEIRRRKKTKGAPSPQKAPVVPAETLIGEAEDALNAVNAEIEACFARADFSQIKDLYGKRNELAERIDKLYEAWE